MIALSQTANVGTINHTVADIIDLGAADDAKMTDTGIKINTLTKGNRQIAGLSVLGQAITRKRWRGRGGSGSRRLTGNRAGGS